MPWNETSTVKLRQSFVELAETASLSMTDLCQQFEISRKTGYKILARHLASEGLENRSRRPHSNPNQTSSDMEDQVVKLRQLYGWGGKKIHANLSQKGLSCVPAASTITDIIRRHGLLTKTKTIATNAYQRFEHPAPNDLWQMDYKGHFALQEGRCFPLTILDDHSRFSLKIQACRNQQALTVKNHLTEVFQCYGLPLGINVDNGSPWGTQGRDAITSTEVWLIKQGVYLSHSRPCHPQTNGKLERFHRSLKYEVLARTSLNTLEQAQQTFDAWRQVYNYERPHEALHQQTPATRYRESPRRYQESPQAFEYSGHAMVRKVQSNGYITFENQEIWIGEGLIGEHVAVYETEETALLAIYFCQKRIKQVTLDRRSV